MRTRKLTAVVTACHGSGGVGATGPALANIGLSLVLGLAAVWLGVSLGRAVWA